VSKNVYNNHKPTISVAQKPIQPPEKMCKYTNNDWRQSLLKIISMKFVKCCLRSSTSWQHFTNFVN